MICKECRPVFDPAATPQYMGVTHVEFCPRHADMEQKQSGVDAFVASVLEEAKERRGYALLQAAATIVGRHVLDLARLTDAEKKNSPYYQTVRHAVTSAQELLIEIEDQQQEEDTERGDPIATCVGCGCRDDRPCEGGCSWVWTNRHRRLGVCSKCARIIEREALKREKEGQS